MKIDAQKYDNWKLSTPNDNEKILAYDWGGDEIYDGIDIVEYFDTPYGYVRMDIDEVCLFMRDTFDVVEF